MMIPLTSSFRLRFKNQVSDWQFWYTTYFILLAIRHNRADSSLHLILFLCYTFCFNSVLCYFQFSSGCTFLTGRFECQKNTLPTQLQRQAFEYGETTSHLPVSLFNNPQAFLRIASFRVRLFAFLLAHK